ncbi:hypothetical protein LCGC14_2722540, partial [marine sediment metagenome]
HVQLSTRTKMFCGCELSFGKEPNVHTCPICLGHPGTLPVPNASAVRQALEMPGLEVVGLHVHLGSPLFELEPYREAVDVLLAFAAEMGKKHGLKLDELSPGGGFAVQYMEGQAPPAIGEYAEAIVSGLTEGCRKHGLPLPRLIIEPGRAIVARAGVALYTVGASKEVPGVRRFVSVDGGIADNIRPPLYESQYSALVASKALETRRERVTIAGRYCESGDILMRDADLAPLDAGDSHAFFCTHSNEVRLKLCEGSEDVEEYFSHWISRIVYAGTKD